MASNKLNPRQEAFVREYLIDRNGAAAAIRAGYSPNSAKGQAYDLLHHNDEVKRAIALAEGKLAEAAGITAVRVLEELAAIGFARMGDFAEWGGDIRVKSDGKIEIKPRPSRLKDSRKVDTRAVSQVTIGPDGKTTIKLGNKVAALRMLAQHMRLFDRPDPTKQTREDDPDFDGTLWDDDDDDDAGDDDEG